METTITPEVVEESSKAQLAMFNAARTLAATLKTEEDYTRAGNMLVEIKNWRNGWDRLTKPSRDAAKLALDNVRAMFKKLDDPLQMAEEDLKRARGKWRAQLEEENRKKEAQLRAEMQKQADDAKLNTAVALEGAGQKQMAEQVLETPSFVPPVVLPGAPKLAGSSERTYWKFQITDEAALPREYLMPDEKKIGQVVRAMKEKAVGHIPGVYAYPDQSEAVGAAR